MYTVVTSFSPDGWALTGARCVETIKQHWPAETFTYCMWEGQRPATGLYGGDLLQLKPVADFITRHANNLEVQGKLEGRLKWGRKAREAEYNFRTDAFKFARKVFALAHVAPFREGKLFWLDADVITHSPIPRTFLEDVLPDDCCLCYLPRPGYHSELGFLGCNLAHVRTRQFIDAWQAIYASDLFLSLGSGYTDCHTFDHLVLTLQPRVQPIRHSSLAQPFDSSRLASYMTHFKGARKNNSGEQRKHIRKRLRELNDA